MHLVYDTWSAMDLGMDTLWSQQSHITSEKRRMRQWLIIPLLPGDFTSGDSLAVWPIRRSVDCNAHSVVSI